MMMKRGEDLKAGDNIRVWWKPGVDRIIKLRPYSGTLDFLNGAHIADFAINRCGMTIEPHALFDVVE